MNRFTWILGAVLWFVVVFWTTLYLTFPSAAVSAFVGRVVHDRTAGRYALEMSDTKPWWVGLSGSGVIVSSVVAGVHDPMFAADRLAVRLSPWALLRKARQFYVEVGVDDAWVDVQISAVDQDGVLKLRKAYVEVTKLPVQLLSGLMRGKECGGFSAEGSVDVTMDLKMTEGIDKASGTIDIRGDGVVITSISSPSMGIPEMPVDVGVSELDVRLDGKGGALDVVRGVVHTSLGDVDLRGELTMADPWNQSKLRFDLDVAMTGWEGSPLERYRTMAESFMSSAKCDDGKYHYDVNTTVGRFGASDLRPQRCKTSRVPPRVEPSFGTIERPPLGDGEAVPPAAAPTAPLVPVPIPVREPVIEDDVLDDELSPQDEKDREDQVFEEE